MLRIVIPKNQQLKKDDFAMIWILNMETGIHSELFIKSEEETSTASYDTACDISEFDPFKHGFVGLNDPLCKLLISLGYDSQKIQDYIKWSLGVEPEPEY